MARLKRLPDDIDLAVVPGGRTAEGDKLMSQFIARQRKQRGYAAAVKRLEKTVGTVVATSRSKQKAKRVA